MRLRSAPLVSTVFVAVLLPVLLGLAACAGDEREPTVASQAQPSLDPEVEDELWADATAIFEPLPAAAPNPDNPVTEAKVALGRKLYFDPRLSKEGNVSCNSCHSLANFGVDSLPFSPGDAGELGGRNSPTVLNAALHVAQFWDGRAQDVEEQAGMPILNPVEMAIPSEEFLVRRLSGVEDYPELFATAFPEEEPALTYRNVARALGAFERTLLTPSRFDEYLEGDRDALTSLEKHGLLQFMELGCVSCHNGVNAGAASFRKFGLMDPYWEHTGSEKIDEGRYSETREEPDKYVFKVASLRNVEKTAPYFHDGSVESLDQAVRIMGEVQLGTELDAEQVESVTAFLRSLTGELPPPVVASFDR